MQVIQINFVTVRTRSDSKISFYENIEPSCKSLVPTYGVIRGSVIGGFFITERGVSIKHLQGSFSQNAHFTTLDNLSLLIISKIDSNKLCELEKKLKLNGVNLHEQWETDESLVLCFSDNDICKAKNCVNAVLGIQDF